MTAPSSFSQPICWPPSEIACSIVLATTAFKCIVISDPSSIRILRTKPSDTPCAEKLNPIGMFREDGSAIGDGRLLRSVKFHLSKSAIVGRSCGGLRKFFNGKNPCHQSAETKRCPNALSIFPFLKEAEASK